MNGNIGDRDAFAVRQLRYSVHEVQYAKGDFASWRVYLNTWQTGTVAYLPIMTHGGSTAFANPSVTLITSPSGRPAVVVTLFVPSEGAGPGEAGQLLFFREYVPLPEPQTGLSATYFDDLDFTGATLVRVDPRIDLDFGTGQAVAQPRRRPVHRALGRPGAGGPSEAYTFYTQTDDGARLWVNGIQLVNDWTDHGVVENRGTIALTAGRRYDLTMEYYDNGGGALARLLWSSPGTPKAVVPADRLFQPSTASRATTSRASRSAARPTPAPTPP